MHEHLRLYILSSDGRITINMHAEIYFKYIQSTVLYNVITKPRISACMYFW